VTDVWLLIDEVSISHTATHHSRYDSSGRVVSLSRRPLPDNTQHSQQTDIRAPGGIRTHNLRSRAAVGLRLWLRGHWDRLFTSWVSDLFFSAIATPVIVGWFAGRTWKNKIKWYT